MLDENGQVTALGHWMFHKPYWENALYGSACREMIYLADAKGEEKYPLQTGENAKQNVC